MKTEEELKAIEQKQIKNARKVAATYGTLAIVALISIVYAFFQQAAAERAKIELTQELVICQKISAEAEAREAQANKKVEQLMIDAQIAREVAEDANKSIKKK